MEDEVAEIRTAAVVGLGLIGGSIARDLAARGVRVLGWDAHAKTLRAAVEAGVVHQPLSRSFADIRSAEVVVLAVPVLAAVDLLHTLAPELTRARLVTDAGSTKTSIVRAAQSLGIGARFVGSHPLAGDHRSGWDASREGLFADARVFLCPTHSTDDEALRLASALWTMLGGRPETIDPDRHDVHMAWRSHLPQVVSTALALTISQTGTPPSGLGPGGRDVTRLAGSDPAMWADVLIDNADALASALAMAQVQLSSLARAVADRDRDGLVRSFTEARRWHERKDE